MVDPPNYLFPNITTDLGSSFTSALGAKIAHSDRAAVCFTGDGCFVMGSPELSTAEKYGLNMVTIVVNDGALSGINGSQHKVFEGRIVEADLHNPDFVAFANSFGAYGRRVEDLSDFKSVFWKPFRLIGLH